MFDNCLKKTMKKSKKFENRTADWLLDRAGLFLTIFIYQKNHSRRTYTSQINCQSDVLKNCIRSCYRNNLTNRPLVGRNTKRFSDYSLIDVMLTPFGIAI